MGDYSAMNLKAGADLPRGVRRRQVFPSNYLYTPAFLVPSLVARTFEVDPDALVIDLEDSIHVRQKDAARAVVAESDFSAIRARGVALGLRVNSFRTTDGLRDLAMLADLAKDKIPFDFVLVPKLECSEEIKIYRQHMTALDKSVDIHAFIETIDAVEDVDGIAKFADALIYGQADLYGQLYAPNPHYLLEVQARVTASAAKYRIAAIDANSFEIEDMAKVEAEAIAGRQAGFTGMVAIHPRQIPVINKIFDVTESELSAYRQTVRDYYEREVGFRIVDGRVIAPPFVAKAELMLEIYDRQ